MTTHDKLQVCVVQFAANAAKRVKRTAQSEQMSDFLEKRVARASPKSNYLQTLGNTKHKKTPDTHITGGYICHEEIC